MRGCWRARDATLPPPAKSRNAPRKHAAGSTPHQDNPCRAPESTIRHRKSGRFDDMRLDIKAGGHSQHRARILGNIRLKQGYMHFLPFLEYNLPVFGINRMTIRCHTIDKSFASCDTAAARRLPVALYNAFGARIESEWLGIGGTSASVESCKIEVCLSGQLVLARWIRG